MGFFSFKTQDTGKSIANVYSTRDTFKVYMHDDKGNVWEEDTYGGYGDFGGKDYYQLVADMNGLKDRNEAITRCFDGSDIKHPNLTESRDWTWVDSHPEICDAQGYFYN